MKNDEKDEKAFYSVSYTDDWEENHRVFPTEVERMTFGLTGYVSETSLKDVGEL